jgi:hypothetical protein
MNDPKTKLQNYFAYWRRVVSDLIDFIPDDYGKAEAENLL